jgi:transcriptional regulator with GAF, ATPase, and Fis domain
MADRDLLQSIAELARAIFKARAASVAVLDAQEGAFVFEAVAGVGDWMVGARFAAGEGIAGAVAQRGLAEEVPDLGADPRFARGLAERTGYVPAAMMVAPLRAGGQVRGVLSVLDRGDGAQGTETLSAFADLAALAL